MPDGLLPDAPASGSIAVDREISSFARTWGRILDTSPLLPGDLVLTRSIKPDTISAKIVAAQTKGGLPARHAQWTHAAVYLGDGDHICEASFKETGFKWGVNIRSIYDYCSGEFAIRVRRPSGLSAQQRVGVAIGAMVSVGNGYNFREILSFRSAAVTGKGFWQGNVRQRINPKALVCSTLYQDAYNFASKGMSVRMGSLCTPAHLSASSDFDPVDPVISWLTIS